MNNGLINFDNIKCIFISEASWHALLGEHEGPLSAESPQAFKIAPENPQSHKQIELTEFKTSVCTQTDRHELQMTWQLQYPLNG